MRTIDYTNKWRLIYKILPVKTEDGFNVYLDYVWQMKTDDIRNPVRYCVRVDDAERMDLSGRTVTGDLEILKATDQIRRWAGSAVPMPKVKPPLTEGKMRHGNPPPPVGRGERPKPPPAPPRPSTLGKPKKLPGYLPLGKFRRAGPKKPI